MQLFIKTYVVLINITYSLIQLASIKIVSQTIHPGDLAHSFSCAIFLVILCHEKIVPNLGSIFYSCVA